MALDSGAAEEIERTLRLEREAVERQIAHYRVILFLGVTLVTVSVFALQTSIGREGTVIPCCYFAACAVYAVLIRRVFLSRQPSGTLVYGALTMDLLAIAGIFPVVHLLGRTDRGFAAHLLGAGLLLVLLVNMLRMNAKTSVYGAAVSSLLALSVLEWIEGFQPAQVALALSFWLTPLIGIAAARQARRALEDFARHRLLQRYLAPAAVERVLRDNPDKALALGGRQLRVSLIAADLRGFTTWAERLKPDELVSQLNAYHKAMLDQIERHGGTLDKFIGDGILAVFDMEGTSPDHGAQAATSCGASMLRALKRLNLERNESDLPPLQMGVGVHTGDVVAGNIGSPGRRIEFTVIGDAVNVVSRLEGLTKETGTPLLVSGETATLLGEHALRELAPMTVRGRTSPLRVFTPNLLSE
jgi:class 3 adenylate cyclase